MSEFISKKWLVIINPSSGNGKVKKKWKKIVKKELDVMNVNYTEYFTTGPEDAITKIGLEIDNFDGFVSVGGDGTANEVLNGILLSTVEQGKPNDKLLVIIPGGTGNDLATAMGMPNKNLEESCNVFKTGKLRKVDAGRASGINFSGESVTRFFCGVLSTGFDAEVAIKTNSGAKWLPGTFNYVKSLLTTLIKMKTRGYAFKVDSEEHTENGILLAVGLGPYYGGGMMICPNAKVDDGKFDVVFLKKVSRRTLLRVFPKVYDGKHLTHPAVTEYETESINISNTIDTYWQVDGEVIGFTPVSITTAKESLNILAPEQEKIL